MGDPSHGVRRSHPSPPLYFLLLFLVFLARRIEVFTIIHHFVKINSGSMVFIYFLDLEIMNMQG